MPGVLWLDLERWSEPVSTVSEQFRDFLIYQEMVYAKAQLFYEQLRYVLGDETMRRVLRAYFSRWHLKHVDEDAFRRVAEEVSKQDLKWLFGEWLHATPLVDYRLRRVERHRLADRRWRTVVTLQRLRRRDARRRDPHQLPRPLRAQPAARVGWHPGGRGPGPRRHLRPLGQPDSPPRAAHRDEPRRMVRGGTGGRRALGRPRAAGAPGLRRRSPRRLRRPLDGHDECRLSRPPAVGGRGDDRGRPLGLHHRTARVGARAGAAPRPRWRRVFG